jgi:hypothetical protein
MLGVRHIGRGKAEFLREVHPKHLNAMFDAFVILFMLERM